MGMLGVNNMVKFKVVIGTKSGKSLQKELSEEESKYFLGKILKEAIKGDLIGFPGYEFLITGGSDYCGFPMRWDVNGTGRNKILAVAPTTGLKRRSQSKKAKVRKLVCGNSVHEKIAQVNLKVLKEGSNPLFEEPKAPEEKPGPTGEKKE